MYCWATIVMHNIKEGRIPLIIDGFDELLNEDIDKANAAGDKNKGQDNASDYSRFA